MSEATRAYIYRISAALLALLAGFGIISGEKVPLIIGVLGALLPTGLAVRNTSTKAP